MEYKAKDFSHLLGMKGFSDELLTNHFKLYEGYVKNANQMIGTLTRLLKEGEVPSQQFSEIKRRLPFEVNGIKLHEYYFGNLTKENPGELERHTELFRKLTDEFGGYPAWKKSLKGVASMRGVGWALVIYDPRADLILNTWVEQHHDGHIAGTVPLLVIDLWEHAMLLDYGSNRPEYLESLFHVIDWPAVSERYDAALDIVHAGRRG